MVLEASDMPIGFTMALAQNTAAMTYFSSLSDEQRQSVIRDAENIHSREQMHHYVSRLGR